GRDARSLLREFWESERPGPGFEAFWEEALQRGTVEGTASPRVTAKVNWSSVTEAVHGIGRRERPEGLETNFLGDLAVHDGRYADNGWLQELPNPITKTTWDNAATMSPATAMQLGVSTGSLVSIQLDGREIVAPVLTVPLQADDTVCINVGYGRSHGSST